MKDTHTHIWSAAAQGPNEWVIEWVKEGKKNRWRETWRINNTTRKVENIVSRYAPGSFLLSLYLQIPFLTDSLFFSRFTTWFDTPIEQETTSSQTSQDDTQDICLREHGQPCTQERRSPKMSLTFPIFPEKKGENQWRKRAWLRQGQPDSKPPSILSFPIHLVDRYSPQWRTHANNNTLEGKTDGRCVTNIGLVFTDKQFFCWHIIFLIRYFQLASPWLPFSRS